MEEQLLPGEKMKQSATILNEKISPEVTLLWKYKTDDIVETVSVSADGSLIVAGSDLEVYLFTKEGKLLWKCNAHSAVSNVLVVDDAIFCSGWDVDYHGVRLLARSGNLLWDYSVSKYVETVACSPDGSLIAVGSQNKKVYLFERAGGLLWSYKTGGTVYCVSIPTDGSVIAAGSQDKKVYLLSRDGKLLWSYKTGGKVYAVSVSADGSIIAAGSTDKKVYLLAKEGTLQWAYQIQNARAVYWPIMTAADGSLVAARSRNRLFLFSKNGEPLWSFQTGGIIKNMGISAFGSLVVASSDDGNVYFFTPDNKQIAGYQTGGSVEAVSMSADGSFVAAGSEDCNVYLFHCKTSEALVKQTKAEIISMIEKAAKEP
jgi:WD40 repeat protein